MAKLCYSQFTCIVYDTREGYKTIRIVNICDFHSSLRMNLPSMKMVLMIL